MIFYYKSHFPLLHKYIKLSLEQLSTDIFKYLQPMTAHNFNYIY